MVGIGILASFQSDSVEIETSSVFPGLVLLCVSPCAKVQLHSLFTRPSVAKVCVGDIYKLKVSLLWSCRFWTVHSYSPKCKLAKIRQCKLPNFKGTVKVYQIATFLINKNYLVYWLAGIQCLICPISNWSDRDTAVGKMPFWEAITSSLHINSWRFSSVLSNQLFYYCFLFKRSCDFCSSDLARPKGEGLSSFKSNQKLELNKLGCSWQGFSETQKQM